MVRGKKKIYQGIKQLGNNSNKYGKILLILAFANILFNVGCKCLQMLTIYIYIYIKPHNPLHVLAFDNYKLQCRLHLGHINKGWTDLSVMS